MYNMKKRFIWGVAIAIVLAIGLWAYNHEKVVAPVLQNQGEAATPASEKFTWSFAEAPMDESTSAPMTKVTLIAESTNKAYSVGTYMGSCAVIESSQWNLLQGEKTGVICWWAGGGKEIAIFPENGKFVLKIGDIEEATEETQGFRGNFKALLEI